MPVGRPKSIWPARVAWPRRQDGLPGLIAAEAVPPAYARGRSRFVLAPLSLGYDQLLFLAAAALLAIGLVMVQSADARIRGVIDTPLWQSFLNKNAMHAAIAVGTMFLVWRLDYRLWLGRSLLLSPATLLVALTTVALVAVLATPLGRDVNGARRWLGYGTFGFQPSELAKLGLVVFIAAYAVHMQQEMRSFFKGFLPLVAVFGIVCALVVKEDFGTTALIAAVCVTLIFMAGAKSFHTLLLLPPAVGVAYMLLQEPFRRARLLAFLDPWIDPKGVGYHPIQSLLTIMSGGFWGRGLGNGVQKMGYLPEDNTDFIFAVICEELGFPGALIVITLFALFVFCGWRIACRCNNLFGKLLAFGITAMFGLQAAMNIAVVTVSMPTKGIALPLISSGGTGWIMTAAAIGVLMSIERANAREEAGLGGRGPAPVALGFPVQTDALR